MRILLTLGLAALVCLSADAAPVSAGAGGAAGTMVAALVTRSLSGAPGAPVADGEEGILSVQARDASGRLILIGWAQAGSGSAAGRQKAEVSAQAKDTAIGAGVGGGAASKGGAAVFPAPATASSLDGFLFYSFGWDARGRIASISERKGSGQVEAITSWVRGDEGRILRIDRREKGKLVESLAFSWDGSGRSARLLLLDDKGEAKGGGLLEAGEGGIEGRSVFLGLVDAEGKDGGGLSLGWDAAGRLTSWQVRIPSEVLPRSAGSTAKQGAAAGAGPGIIELLFPIWPRDQASFEIFARLADPAARGDFRAFSDAGPLILPFERPKEGSIDFLWDGMGRLISAIQSDASGARTASVECRYDQRGLLVDESYSTDPGTGATAADILRVYGLDSRGRWRECSAFARDDTPMLGRLRPLEWTGHKILLLPPPAAAALP